MISGHCLCGAVHLTVVDHDPSISACHCRMCQRWSGGVFLCFVAKAAGVTVEGPVVRYASSDFAERAFCGTCGSLLWWRNTSHGDADYELTPGLFDAARDWPLRREIYTDRAMSVVRLAGDHSSATRAEFEAGNDHLEGDLP